MHVSDTCFNSAEFLVKDEEWKVSINTHTRSPGESSVYSLSIVLLEPPAPAARVELGFAAVLPARRLRVRITMSAGLRAE